MALGQSHHDLARSVDELGVVGNITALGCTVVSMITRARSFGRIASVRVATARLSCSSAMSFSSPIRWRQRVNEERSNSSRVGELLTAEELEIWVLDPSIAHCLVREVIHVLEDGEPRHQPRRQRRTAGPSV